jgi:hypothetical protein
MAQVVEHLPSNLTTVPPKQGRKKVSYNRAGDTVQWYSTCQAHTRPWVQSPTLEKKKKEGGGGSMRNHLKKGRRQAGRMDHL